jgi:hypothetical protein
MPTVGRHCEAALERRRLPLGGRAISESPTAGRRERALGVGSESENSPGEGPTVRRSFERLEFSLERRERRQKIPTSSFSLQMDR